MYSTRTEVKAYGSFYDDTGDLVYEGFTDAMPDNVISLLNAGQLSGSTGPADYVEQYQTGTIHHDAVTHQEQVVVQAAYDEQVIVGYICSCGETKE